MILGVVASAAPLLASSAGTFGVVRATPIAHGYAHSYGHGYQSYAPHAPILASSIVAAPIHAHVHTPTAIAVAPPTVVHQPIPVDRPVPVPVIKHVNHLILNAFPIVILEEKNINHCFQVAVPQPYPVHVDRPVAVPVKVPVPQVN